MTEKKIDELINKFTLAAKRHYEASLVGDWKTANQNAVVIRQIVRKLNGLGEEARKALLDQTKNQEPSVSAMAAVYSLEYAPEESVKVLTEIAKGPDLIGFEATQALQRWKEGEWNLDE